MKLSHLATEYVKVPIVATASGLPVDPTAATVTMAFTAVGVDPVSGDWKAASWETDATRTPARYSARCLVGPTGGTITFVQGSRWWVWAKISGIAPEEPVERAPDLLEIT